MGEWYVKCWANCVFRKKKNYIFTWMYNTLTFDGINSLDVMAWNK